MTTKPDRSRDQAARARGYGDFDVMLAAEPAMADVVNVLTWMDAQSTPPVDHPERRG